MSDIEYFKKLFSFLHSVVGNKINEAEKINNKRLDDTHTDEEEKKLERLMDEIYTLNCRLIKGDIWIKTTTINSTLETYNATDAAIEYVKMTGGT